MKPTTRTLLTLLVLAAPGSLARAQMAPYVPPQTAQGHFSNWAVGVTARGQTWSASGAPGIRAPGVNGGAPANWTASTFGAASHDHPDYSLTALTANWPVAGLTPDFGDVSTGGDVTPAVTSGGQLVLTGQNWYALTFSVDDNAIGEANSLIRLQSTGRSPAGDIFSYYAPGSAGINPALVDTVRVEYTREQLQLGQGLTNLSNLDFGMGVISIDAQARSGPIVPVRDRFYFTLTQAWLNSTQGHLLLKLDGQTPDSSTIYVMTWGSSGWSAPSIAYSTSELFGSTLTGPVEIDAISVYQYQTPTGIGNDRVVFSLTPASDSSRATPFDQILVFQRMTNGGSSAGGADPCATQPLKALTANGPVNVSTRIGLRPRTPTGEPDNVDSSCGLDPNRYDPSTPWVFAVLAMATSQPLCGDGALGLTGIRTTLPDPSGAAGAIDTLHLQVAGLQFPTSVYPFGVVRFYLEGPPAPPHGGAQVAPVQVGSDYLILPGSPLTPLNISSQVSAQVGATPTRLSAKLFGVSFTPEIHLVELRSSWILSLLL